MLITKEFTLLYGQGCEDRRIIPGIPFEPFEGEYIVSAYARIRDKETGEIITLTPGERISGVGKVEKQEPIKAEPKPKRKKKVDEDAV